MHVFGSKPECPEQRCNLCTERPKTGFKPRIFLLWHSSPNRCTIVQFNLEAAVCAKYIPHIYLVMLKIQNKATCFIYTQKNFSHTSISVLPASGTLTSLEKQSIAPSDGLGKKPPKTLYFCTCAIILPTVRLCCISSPDLDSLHITKHFFSQFSPTETTFVQHRAEGELPFTPWPLPSPSNTVRMSATWPTIIPTHILLWWYFFFI